MKPYRPAPAASALSIAAILAVGLACQAPEERQVKPPGGGDEDGTNKKTDGIWLTLPADAVPSARSGHTAVWSGSEMLVFGGESVGGRLEHGGGGFQVSKGTWRPLSGTSPAGRTQHAAVWTSAGMVVWGGLTLDRESGEMTPTSSGGIYVPQSGAWFPTANDETTATARFGHTAVAAGSRMIVWGGRESAPLGTGAVLDAATGQWSATATTNAPAPRHAHTAVWTGSEMIVWGGVGEHVEQTGAIYDLAKNEWRPISTDGAPDPRRNHTAVWVEGRMIVFGGMDRQAAYLSTGGIYELASDTWSPLPEEGAPLARTSHLAAATTQGMIIYGGYADDLLGNGGYFDLESNKWRRVGPLPTLPKRAGATGVWTGSSFLVWGGRSGAGKPLDSGSALFVSPATRGGP